MLSVQFAISIPMVSELPNAICGRAIRDNHRSMLLSLALEAAHQAVNNQRAGRPLAGPLAAVVNCALNRNTAPHH